jgi:hypothetical protein
MNRQQTYSLRLWWMAADGYGDSRWFLWGGPQFESELADLLKHSRGPIRVEVEAVRVGRREVGAAR